MHSLCTAGVSKPKTHESATPDKNWQAQINTGFDALVAFASSELDRSRELKRKTSNDDMPVDTSPVSPPSPPQPPPSPPRDTARSEAKGLFAAVKLPFRCDSTSAKCPKLSDMSSVSGRSSSSSQGPHNSPRSSSPLDRRGPHTPPGSPKTCTRERRHRRHRHSASSSCESSSRSESRSSSRSRSWSSRSRSSSLSSMSSDSSDSEKERKIKSSGNQCSKNSVAGRVTGSTNSVSPGTVHVVNSNVLSGGGVLVMNSLTPAASTASVLYQGSGFSPFVMDPSPAAVARSLNTSNSNDIAPPLLVKQTNLESHPGSYPEHPPQIHPIPAHTTYVSQHASPSLPPIPPVENSPKPQHFSPRYIRPPPPHHTLAAPSPSNSAPPVHLKKHGQPPPPNSAPPQPLLAPLHPPPLPPIIGSSNSPSHPRFPDFTRPPPPLCNSAVRSSIGQPHGSPGLPLASPVLTQSSPLPQPRHSQHSPNQPTLTNPRTHNPQKTSAWPHLRQSQPTSVRPAMSSRSPSTRIRYTAGNPAPLGPNGPIDMSRPHLETHHPLASGMPQAGYVDIRQRHPNVYTSNPLTHYGLPDTTCMGQRSNTGQSLNCGIPPHYGSICPPEWQTFSYGGSNMGLSHR